MSKLILCIIVIIALLVVLSMGMTAGIAVLCYGLLALLCSLLGAIPFVGWLFYIAAMYWGVTPLITQYVQMCPAISILYWLFLVIAVIYSIITSLTLVVAIRN